MASPAPSQNNNVYFGGADPNSATSEYNALSFLFRTLAGQMWTVQPVLVMAVTGGGPGATATVSVQPMVNQLDGNGIATPHGTINGLPCMRIQGGANALIIDPEVGDIGVAIFAHNDISSVKSTKAPANPGSARKFDPADGIYIGGLLGKVVATRYIQVTDTGINITAPDAVTITAPTINLNGAVVGNSTAAFTGNVTGAGTSLHTHIHSGVTTGSGNSGAPV